MGILHQLQLLAQHLALALVLVLLDSEGLYLLILGLFALEISFYFLLQDVPLVLHLF